MGTNFYLQSRNPIYYYPCIHLTKRSWGWIPLWQEHEEGEEHYLDDYELYKESDVTIPNIHSIDDIRQAQERLWVIVDEYGEEYTWEQFEEEVVNWNGGDSDNPDFIPRTHEDLRSKGFEVRKDKDGYEWTNRDFR